MAVLVTNCPHCAAEKVGFQLVAEAKSPVNGELIHGWFCCPACGEFISATFHNSWNQSLSRTTADLRSGSSGHHLSAIYPTEQYLEAPEFTPENVADLYLEAMDSHQRGKWTSASAMFRSTLEAALKTSAPEIDRWKLEKRIDDMAAAGLITPALKDWAHALRLDGNETLHGSKAATPEISTQMQAFCENLLTYLFTMPERVRRSREVGGHD